MSFFHKLKSIVVRPFEACLPYLLRSNKKEEDVEKEKINTEEEKQPQKQTKQKQQIKITHTEQREPVITTLDDEQIKQKMVSPISRTPLTINLIYSTKLMINL